MRSWLKKLRQENNYSQAHMAELLGISRQYYGFIENGDRLADLTFSLVIKIAKIFDITLDDIKKFEEGKAKN